MKHRVLILTGGGDCPGLNAVIRAVVKRAAKEPDWEVVGSIDAFNGVLNEPNEIVILDEKAVAGIHVKGGTILGTTNKGGPFSWPIKNPDGTWSTVDRSDELLRRLQFMGIDAVINVGGDGSQRISQQLFEKGCNIIGIPKTIDNDLSCTEFTFGFQTAVETATDALDKLVTTAESHHRLLILEVMGRYAGWIALHAAIAGGADICLIPEIPYSIDSVIKRIQQRMNKNKGFAIIVTAEGAKPIDGDMVYEKSDEVGYENIRLGGTGSRLMSQLKEKNIGIDIRETILGHLQRGGTPIAFDRILATQFGVKAFEMVLEGQFGQMVSYAHPNILSVPLKKAIETYNLISLDSSLLQTARGISICLGD